MVRLCILSVVAWSLGLTGCKLVIAPSADAAAERVQVNPADSELAAIAAPGAFVMSVDQDSDADQTVEVHWTKADHALRYRLTVALGDDCIGSEMESPDVYDLTTNGVELPPLKAGTYTLCATAIGHREATTEAGNSGLSVVVRAAE